MFSFASSTKSSDILSNDIVASETPQNASCIAFNQLNNVAGGSWSGDVFVWALENNAMCVKSKCKFDAPVMDVDWAGNYILTASADKYGWLWDPVSNQKRQFAVHDHPIKSVLCLKDNPNVAVTGSWDASVKFWDIRKQGECVACDVKERVYAMESKSFVLAVAVAERGVLVLDVRKPNEVVKAFVSPLRMATRSICLFKELDGLAIGSIEGRVAIKYFKDESRSFNYKAHRERRLGENYDLAHTINTLATHPVYGTLVTGASDGVISLWDKNAKQKMKSYEKCAEPIVDLCFNKEGTALAYVMAYDYGQGNDRKMHESRVYVKKVDEKEMRPKN